MSKSIQSGTFKYRLRYTVVVRDEKWELWQGFRELAMVRLSTGTESLDFEGEWLGWDRILKTYLQVEIPADINLGGHTLNTEEVEDLAGRMHVALCLMKVRNIIVQKRSCLAMPESERDSVLCEFQRWMAERGRDVTANRADGTIMIRAPRWRVFRREPTPEEILAQGKWVAKAFHALHYKEADPPNCRRPSGRRISRCFRSSMSARRTAASQRPLSTG